MTDESTPRSVVALVGLLVALASFVAIGAGFVTFPGSDPVDLLMMATAAGAVAFTQAGLTLHRFRGIRAESLNHDEVVYPFLLVFLGPGGAVVAYAVGSLLAEVISRRSLVKAAFNVSQFAIAAAAGSGVAFLLELPAVKASAFHR